MNRVINHLHNITALLYFFLVDELLIYFNKIAQNENSAKMQFKKQDLPEQKKKGSPDLIQVVILQQI